MGDLLRIFGFAISCD